MIRLWRGYHSPQLQELVQHAWKREELLVLCPPLIRDFSFMSALPVGAIELCGEWGETYAAAQAAIDQRKSYPQNYPQAPVLGVFTSGTASGAPRLALYSKKNIESSLESILEFFDHTKIDSVFCYPQAFHTFGLTLGYVLSLTKNLDFYSGEGRYNCTFHEQWLEVKSSRLLTLGTPTHFQDLLKHVAQKSVTPRVTYSCIIGGAPVTTSLWRDIRDKLRIEAPSIGYGCTEASPGIAHNAPGLQPTVDGEIGRFVKGLNVEILPGVGLEFSGDSLCMAMIQNGEIEFPKRVCINDDVSRRDDGTLVFHGRTDLTLNRGGQKLSLEQVERELTNKLGRDFVCVAIPHKRLGQDLGILLKATADDFDPASLDEVLRESFGVAFNKNHCAEVDGFPLNEAAKVCRKSGAELILNQLLRQEGCI